MLLLTEITLIDNQFTFQGFGAGLRRKFFLELALAPTVNIRTVNELSQISCNASTCTVCIYCTNMYCILCNRVECGHFFERTEQNSSTNQRSGVILEVRFQNFNPSERRARRRTHVKVLIFKKFQGAQMLIFFK